MVLADSSGDDIGWKKWLIAGWAFMECLLFGGLLYGWGSVVFVLKDEGVYADLCPTNVNLNMSSINASDSNIVVNVSGNSSNDSPGYSVNNETDKADSGKDVLCKPQDSNYALCFTIASALFCAGCAVLGHVNYKYGTRVTRILAL